MVQIQTKFMINIEKIRLFEKIQTNFKLISMNGPNSDHNQNIRTKVHTLYLRKLCMMVMTYLKVSNDDILEKTWMVIRILVVPRTC